MKKGTYFYSYNAFKEYDFLETEPYEFISVNSNMKSTQLMVYKKGLVKYIVLVVASGLVGNVDYDWEKLEKEIIDIVVIPNEQEIYWYIRRLLPNENEFDIRGFGIGEKMNISTEGIVYSKGKIFITDYEEGKIKEVKDKAVTFLCTEGY